VTAPGSGSPDLRAEDAALQEVLAAEHVAVWGYGVVGDALPVAQRSTAETDEAAHRDSRDALAELLDSRGADPVAARAAYALPSPVRTAADAAALAVRLENGTSRTWVRLLDQAVQPSTRQLAVDGLTACELRAVAWRTAAGQTPATAPFPGLP
jgi:Domain of unknown function (DUF4439)